MTDRDPDLSALERIPDPWSGQVPPAPVPSTAGRGRTRSELERGRRVALVLGAGWLGAQLFIAGVRGDLAELPLGYTVAFGVAPVVAGLVCFVAAVSPGRLGLGARVGLLATLAVALPLVYVIAGYELSPPYPAAPVGPFKFGILCFNVAIAWTLLPLVAAGFALRGTFVTQATWRSALVGAGAGLIVAATSMLRCPLSGAWHVASSHGGAVIASALLGALVLARVTRA